MTTFMIPTGLLDELLSSLLPVYGQGGPLDGLNAWFSAAIATEPASPSVASQRGALTRWMGYAFGNPRMTRATAQALLPLQPGDPNPFFPIIDATTRESAGLIQADADMTVPVAVGPITRDLWMIPEYAAAIVMVGGDVIGMPVFFEITDTKATCPFSETDESWEIWGTFGVSHAPQQMGAKWYRSSAVGESGELLNASVWVPQMLTGNVTVISHAAFLAVQAENAEQPI